MTIEMELLGVRVDAPSNTPVMVLRELASDQRMLAIAIGHPEAQAIHFALEQVETRRPMTHDLIALLLDELDTSISRIVVSAMRDSIYYADIVLDRGGDEHVVSARPSDAMAIAVRTGSPVFASEDVMSVASFVEEPDDGDDADEGDPDEMVEQFREFIDQVNPEDFAS